MKAISTLIFTGTLVAFVFTGCSKNSTIPTEATADVPQFDLSPSDGAAAVRLDAPIGLWFAKPVDRGVVERGFHLISERAMADSVCPVSRTMSHGNMMDSMADSSKIHHLGQYHTTRGRFSWSSDSTQCFFRPDTMMTSRTQYMIHFNREITQMMERRIGSMGMLGAHGSGMMASEMMFHFTTMDTAQLGSGHDAHH
jgi:hypothetical protein